VHWLVGCIAKLQRGEEHLASFVAEAQGYIDSGPYRIAHHFEPQTSDYLFNIKVVREPPVARWGTMIGDVLHNLRSALDYLVYDLARLDTGKDRPQGTQFPIVTQDAKRYREKGLPYVAMLSGPHRAAIRRLQPYQADNPSENPLAVLNRLSNADKHRLLHATVGQNAGAGPGFELGGDAIGLGAVELNFGPMEDGAKLARLEIETNGPNPEVEVDGDFAIDIAFRDGAGSVVGTLVEIRSAVAEVVAAFAPAFGMTLAMTETEEIPQAVTTLSSRTSTTMT
jgi:hypothetical protein